MRALITQAEQRRLTLYRAWWVAMSGHYADWRAVCTEVATRGHIRPERWFKTEAIRDQMDRVCREARMAEPTWESEPVWQVIQREHIAKWMRDFDTIAACHLGTADDRWLAKVGGLGITERRGWDALAQSLRVDIRQDPDPCPFIAYRTRFEDRVLRASDTMAWVAFTLAFPTAGLSGWRGPGHSHVLATLEKPAGEWKIASFCVVDDNFGQTDAPTWQVDRLCRLIQCNASASTLMASDDLLRLSGGKLKLVDRVAQEAMLVAIERLAQMDEGLLEPTHHIPIVHDLGHGEPVSVWWATRSGGKLFVSADNPELLRSRLELASRALGLSPAQHRVATAVVEGLALPQVAEREGVRLSTARTQLQRVFDKVGVHSQPALVRSMLSISIG